ncbi:hypothetical protein CCACVL1_14691 [Corchorus capsularis]|uniref:Cyclin-like domain-containing protein n=1 Tax=Corchorus capsularis TaxID=210143 RepID=A0A1R3I688_COCAP|nr:hypothetical protein CCACVL1_14691 [Corchorus capsularis]
MPDRDKDVITWTAVISGYIKLGLIDEARKLFDRVDSKKNVVTWTAMLSGYMRSNQIVQAQRLFDEMPGKNVVSWNTMIHGYVQNGMVDEAFEVFNKMPERNVVSWNTMLTALTQCGRVEDARELFNKMPKRDVISWTAMVAGLAKNGRIDEARRVFDRMPERNIVSWNAMITGYSQNMKLDEAFELFQRMPQRDLSSWNVIITGFIQNGEVKRAEKLFEKMPCKNVVSWTTMITGYVQDGQSEEALKIFSKMLAEDGVKPNKGTFVSVLSACSDLAGLVEGQQVHQTIAKSVYQCSEIVVSALINMYSKCGELSTAKRIFDDGLISQRDVVSWNGMIAAYAHHGCGREAISLFNKMSDLGFKPNDVTYVALLSACSHSGMVEEGLRYFGELVKDRSVEVREDHYACLVDLFSRAGKLKEAYEFIVGLGTNPSVSVWEALLAGCHVHGDVDIGKLVAEKILEAEPGNTGTYLLLSNIYASKGVAAVAHAGKGGAGAVTKVVAAQRKVVDNPKPENVIVISSDEKTEQRRPAACGLTNKPNDSIEDIDGVDVATPLVPFLYGSITSLLVQNEGRVHDYMDLQPEINAKMRSILVDWLIEVHRKFELMAETFYLTINIVDRYLLMKVVPRKEFQLVGISAMLIACKYEEIWAPEVNDFVLYQATLMQASISWSWRKQYWKVKSGI